MNTIYVENDYDRHIKRVWLTFTNTKEGTVFNDLGPLAQGEKTRGLDVPPPLGVTGLPVFGSIIFELEDGDVMSLHSQDGAFALRAEKNAILIHGEDQRIELHVAGQNPQGREIDRLA